MNARCLLGAASLIAATACGSDQAVVTQPPDPNGNTTEPLAMTVLGKGTMESRFTGEVWVHGAHAYTSTWGTRVSNGRSTPGNAFYIWSVSATTPVLLDSVVVAGVGTLGDVQVTADGKYLVVPTEPGPGAILVYDLADPVKPRLLSTFTSPKITRGVHTCELQSVNGRLYAFLSVNIGTNHPARLMIVDLGDPLQPAEVLTLDISSSFIHDVFVRDGILFTAQWDNGMVTYDIGGAGRGGSVQAPVELGTVRTVGGNVHNMWWFHDPSSNAKRFVFVGEEGPASLFSSSSGDLHVVDASSFETAREVAVLRVPNAGVHNFSMDEANGILYAAFYNAGVYAIDARGDLSSCSASQQTTDGRCDLRLMGRVKAVGLVPSTAPVFVWGVHFTGNKLYVSDMPGGLWVLGPVAR